MILLIGGRGRLGSALAAATVGEVRSPDRRLYQHWWRDDAWQEIASVLGNLPPASKIIVAAGLVDPLSDAEDLWRVNVRLPANIARAAAELAIPVITVGTILERQPTPANRYVASKIALSEAMAQLAGAGAEVAHVRLHTLYGIGTPIPSMFLGQIAAALTRSERFDMTSGQQLREYHHTADDAEGLLALAAARVTGVVELSHGEPVTLRHLAEEIFTAFGARHLLNIGGRADPQADTDNYDMTFAPCDELRGLTFRPTIPSVVDYLRRALLAGRRG